MSNSDNRTLAADLRQAAAGRLERLREQFAGQADALLVSAEKDILYLTGFVGHDSLLVVRTDGATIISDSRYDEFLDPWRNGGFCDVAMGTRHALEEKLAELCGQAGITRLGFQAEHVSVAAHQRLAAAVEPAKLVGTTGLVQTLRMRKDALEVSLIREAASLQQAALPAALAELEIGMTELQLRARIDYEMQLRGAAGPSFDGIIAAGPNSSIIHYATGSGRIAEGVLLIDWGAQTTEGYCSDMTRTFSIGPMSRKIREIYGIVLDAQMAAIDACAPGRTCAEIDAVARKVITDAGYGPQFGHGLGHGLGLEVHESPYFNDRETGVVLEPGMVMTVEPGIYVPGVGGVRIEDDVLITGQGADVLCDYPKHPDEMVLEPKGALA